MNLALTIIEGQLDFRFITMLMKRVVSLVRLAMRNFARADDGNVAIIFGLAVIPILAFVGAAIDYSRANAVRAVLQSALDATTLRLSKEAPSDTTTQLQTNAQNYFLAQFTPEQTKYGATNATFTVNYTSAGGTSVVMKASADVPTTFLSILGYTKIKVGSSSTAKWGSSRLRVALVLDNTGSMAQSGKITALKDATNNLLTQLQNAATSDGDVYVSIIPFVKDVNADPSSNNADWIYWGTLAQDPSLSDNTSWDANNGTCSAGNYSTRSQCLANSGCSISGYNSQSSCTAAGTCSNPGETTKSSCTGTQACSNSNYKTKSKCTQKGGTWGYGTWTTGVWSAATWTPNNHNTWNGCVMDRGKPNGPDSGNYDTNVVAPDATNTSTLYAAEQYGQCPQAVMGLSYNWSAMTTEVNDMSPAGNTNQAIGLQLGWMSLVGEGPFTAPPLEPGYTYNQIIILLTDGLNTQDRWYSNQSQIDARETLTCSNIKGAGIILYTVQVSTDGTPISSLLQQCASDSSKFSYLTSSDQIITTFNQIGTNLTKLYVAK